MTLDNPTTRTLCRGIHIRIEDLEIRFKPMLSRPVHGGFLRKVRRITPLSAVLVSMLFSLHCTRPRPLVDRPLSPAAPATEKPSRGPVYEESGRASWYGGNGDGFAGRRTASGEIFDPEQLTCAHRTLPFGTTLQVENLDNGKSATLRVTDRGPYIRNRMLDVSRKAAEDLGFLAAGMARVRIQTVDKGGKPVPVDPVLNEGNPFTIQVAALRDPANIERLRQELQAEFGPVNLQEAVDREGKPIKRVQVGSYMTAEEAEKAADLLGKRLRDRGVEPFITRRR
jgi:rare lipoprotein A